VVAVRSAGVLFDLDDTLLDHRGAARRALQSWCAQLGVPGSIEEWDARWLTLETEFYRRFQARELSNEEQRRARVRHFLPDHDLAHDDDADEAFAGYWREYEASWQAFPDAVPALERARTAGLRVGVITNGDATLQRAKVAATALADLDLPILASSELPAAKPDPTAFTAACAAIGVEAGDCTMVGDVPEIDVEGAKAAGLDAVLLDRFGRHEVESVRAVRSLQSLEFALPGR
jgi:putative hydrolase of the HAD superfamily